MAQARVPGGVAVAIILAAGGGTRMRSAIAKPLHTLAGRSLLQHMINAAELVQPETIAAVVGTQREQVEGHLAQVAPKVVPLLQAQPLGTGDAVRAGLAGLAAAGVVPDGPVLVLPCDAPLLAGETLQALVAQHQAEDNAVTVLTSRVADPTGYGRIVRSADGAVREIVEHRDADATVLSIDEINSSVFVFDAEVLTAGLASLTSNNAQQEYYLTDVVRFAVTAKRRVGGHLISDSWQTEGINDRVQLATLGAELNRRICQKWMRAGVTIVDPATTWIQADVTLAPDVTLLPGTHLEGATTIATGARIGPETTVIDSEVGERAEITRSHVQLALIGPEATIGPYARVRPGSQLERAVHLGSFVETKNASFGVGAKMGHLAYAGDASIGAAANIGAGVVIANYDGINKNHTTIGEASFVGSNSVLCAPLEVAAGTYVAAGSAITKAVAPGELAVARAQQRNISGWVARARAGTTTAAAAAQNDRNRQQPPGEVGSSR